MKKVKIIMMSIILILSLTSVAFGCGNDPVEEKINLGLDKAEAIVAVGETIIITPIVDKKDVIIEWSSSDSTIATTNKYGNVTGVKAGNVVISAKIGNLAEATCKVEVIETNDYPTIALGRSSLEMAKTQPFTLTPSIVYKGQVVEGTFTYSVQDPSIATVSATGVVTGTGFGYTTITVKSQYKGTLIEKTIDVCVKEDNIKYALSSKDVTLYTFNDGVVDNHQTIIAEVKIDEVIQPNITVEWTIDDTSIATIDNGEIVAVNTGETKAHAKWVSVNGIKYIEDIKITILPTNIQSSLKFDLEKGKYNDIDALATVYDKFFENNITQITTVIDDASKNIQFTQKERTLLISDEKLPMGDYSVTIKTNKILISTSVTYCTKIIKTTDDLLNIQTFGNVEANPPYTYNGYFVLANNIDFNGDVNNPDIKSDYSYGGQVGYTGIFDGRGYSIKNLNITTEGGLFGEVGELGTVKNVAFENIQLNSAGGIFGKEFDGILENVFISATHNGIEKSGALGHWAYNAKIKDCVFVVGGTLGANSGALCDVMTLKGAVQFLNNVYAVTSLKLANSIKDTSGMLFDVTVDATSVTSTGLDANIWDTTTNVNYPTFKTATKTILQNNIEYELYSGYAGSALTANAPYTNTKDGAIKAIFNGNNYLATENVITIPQADMLTAGVGENVIKLYTANEIYVTPITILTKIIKTKDDLLNIQLYGNVEADSPYTYNGYFVLANNIDFNGGENNLNIKADYSYGGPVGYTGIFDGRGYSIKNLNIKTEGGLFGEVGELGTVKNVAFENIQLNSLGGIFGKEFDGILENVFVSATHNGIEKSGALAHWMSKAKIKDCVFVVDGTLGANSGALCDKMSLAGDVQFLNNVYAVTSLKLINLLEDTTGKPFGVTENATSVTTTGLDANIWDTTTNANYPIFKTKI